MKKSKVITSTIAVIVLILAAIAFIWVPTMGSSIGIKSLASWDGKAITNEPNSPFYSKLQYVKRLFETFGGSVPSDPASQEYFNYQLSNTAMSSSIIDLAMQTEAEKAGYTPSDKMINLSLISQFTDQSTGAYSQSVYESTSEAAKLQLKAQVVSELKQNRYIQDLLGYGGSYGLKTSSKESTFVDTMTTEKRSVQYVSFKPTSFPNDKIKEYGLEHKDLFVKYDFSVVSFQDENAASAVSKEILKGTVSFDDALSSQDSSISNTNVDSNGKLTNNYRKDLNMLFPNAEDLNAVISLKEGEVSKPVKMNSLYVVLKCNANPVEPDFEDSSIISQVSYYMRQYEKGIIEDYLIEHANSFVEAAKEKGFYDATLEYRVEPTTTDAFALNYGNSRFLPSISTEDTMLSSISKNDDFFKTVFSLKEGEYSKPFLLNESAYVVTLKEVTEKEKQEDSSHSVYDSENANWSDYYILALLTNQFPLGLAQSTVVDYILQNPKTKNNLFDYY